MKTALPATPVYGGVRPANLAEVYVRATQQWNAISDALALLAANRSLPPEVLAPLPRFHQQHLLGHQARTDQLIHAWQLIEAARAAAEALYRDLGYELQPRLRPLLAALGSDLADPARPPLVLPRPAVRGFEPVPGA